MNANIAPTALPAEWSSWLAENLQRGCDPEVLLQTLRDNGFGSVIDAMAQQLEQGSEPVSWEPSESESVTGTASLNAASVDLRIGTDISLAEPIVRDSGVSGESDDPALSTQACVRFQLESPRIVVIDHLLSAAECQQLIELAQHKKGGLSRSTVVAEADGAEQVDTRRTSHNSWFERGEQALVQRIESRIASLLDYPVERGEGLQILRYERGGEYRPHFDFFDPSLSGSQRHLARGGQRVATVILYLSVVESGGGTYFPELGLRVQPQPGTALFFSNLQADGTPDRRTLHAGLPVISGTKYIATKWLRESAYE